jgi:hypothetical protein
MHVNSFLGSTRMLITTYSPSCNLSSRTLRQIETFVGHEALFNVYDNIALVKDASCLFFRKYASRPFNDWAELTYVAYLFS